MPKGAGSAFRTFAAYAEELKSRPAATNAACLVGHTTFRVAAMDKLERAATAGEIEKMRAMADEAMRSGAIGVSTGTAYPPAACATTEEIIEVCRPLTQYGGLYVTHMRNEDDQVTESIEETCLIGRTLGVPAVISHHKTVGVKNHGRSVETLQAHRAAHERAAAGPRLLSVHRFIDRAALRPARAIDAHHRHVVEAASGVLGPRSRPKSRNASA